VCRSVLILLSISLVFLFISLAVSFFFLIAPATTWIYPLSLHDALPISLGDARPAARRVRARGGRHGLHRCALAGGRRGPRAAARSEEHTSELQSRENLVCRLLLEKKKNREMRWAMLRR